MTIFTGIFKIKNRMDTRGILRVALLTFIVLSLLGSLAFLASGVTKSFATALFESVSGFTTTGATALTSEEKLPEALKIYRAFTQWIGGAGVLVFLASMLKSFDADSSFGKSGDSAQLYRSGIRFSRIALRLLVTYFAGTLLCFFSLLLCGLSTGTALLYSFSTVSTGGFTAGGSLSESLPGAGRTVILIFMMLSCVNFTIFYHAIKKHFSYIVNNSEFFAYIFILFGGCVIVSANLYFTRTFSLADAVHYGIFESVSFGTTTGFRITDISGWPSFSKMTLTMMSFIGGCSASVGSGIKVMRLLILAKLVSRTFISRIHPAAVHAVKMNAKPVSESVNYAVFEHFVTYAAFFLGSMFIISFEAPSLGDSMLAAANLLNNTGGSFSEYSAAMKIFMCIIMLAGRLEFYALLLPFTKNDKKIKK